MIIIWYNYVIKDNKDNYMTGLNKTQSLQLFKIMQNANFLARFDHNFISRIGSRMTNIFFGALHQDARVRNVSSNESSTVFPRLVKHSPIPVESLIMIDRAFFRIFVALYRFLAIFGSLVTGKPKDALKFLKLLGLAMIRWLAVPFELLIQTGGRFLQLFHTETGLKIRRFAQEYFEGRMDHLEESILEEGIANPDHIALEANLENGQSSIE